MIARRKGYRVAVVMPDNVTRERRQLLRLFGAEIIDSPGHLGSNGAVAMAKELVARDPRYVMPYQYGNPANPLAHERTTAEEILADCPEIDVFVAGLGTGGTLMGVARRLKRHRRRHPGLSPPSRCPGDAVQGLRSLEDGFIPEYPRPLAAGRPAPRQQRGVHRRPAGADRSRRASSRASRRAARSRWPAGRGDHGPRHDRGAARRRWLEVPLGGRLGSRPRATTPRHRPSQPLVSDARDQPTSSTRDDIARRVRSCASIDDEPAATRVGARVARRSTSGSRPPMRGTHDAP